MSFAIAWGASFLSMFLIARLRVVRLATAAVELSRRTTFVLLDNSVSEDVKEATARRSATEMACVAGQASWRLLLALAVGSVLPVAAIWAGWTDEQSLSHAFWSWPTLILTLTVSLVALAVKFSARS